VLIANLVSPELIQHILSSHYKEVSAESISKLLMRVQQLYLVRQKASAILALAIELYAVFDHRFVFAELLARDDKDLSPLEQQVMEHVKKNLNKIEVQIELFKREMHLYKKEFIYKGEELSEQVQQWIKLLEAYDLTNQTERENDYKRWLVRHKAAQKSTEELKPINEAKLKAILVVKGKKVSRVAQVVVPKLEEKPVEKKRLQKYRPISPIN
jgi:superfamily II DNA helicase RecQ